MAPADYRLVICREQDDEAEEHGCRHSSIFVCPASHGPRDPTRDPEFDLNAFMSPPNSQKSSSFFLSFSLAERGPLFLLLHVLRGPHSGSKIDREGQQCAF
ncbi:hypothetical protein CEXT_184221 [Caerostris extrusa]|uniref:Uncharacterized protein n=1 Tax=Caerostris extrusa TaxID=172846 RepID=A0AAV4S448_CAEEX|nr:hypothetical protein CEXT_184221 [Caerostris extrusa]